MSPQLEVGRGEGRGELTATGLKLMVASPRGSGVSGPHFLPCPQEPLPVWQGCSLLQRTWQRHQSRDREVRALKQASGLVNLRANQSNTGNRKKAGDQGGCRPQGLSHISL